jgi:hypothetical protein
MDVPPTPRQAEHAETGRTGVAGVNLKTAKTLGLDVPDKLLALAEG